MFKLKFKIVKVSKKRNIYILGFKRFVSNFGLKY
jgi:hypothetical protein